MEFLNIKQAAKILGVTPLTLRNWDKSGKFTASRHPINNYRVYKKSEVDMLLEDMHQKNWKSQSGKRQEEPKVKKLSVRHDD